MPYETGKSTALGEYSEMEKPCDKGVYLPKNVWVELQKAMMFHDALASGLEIIMETQLPRSVINIFGDARCNAYGQWARWLVQVPWYNKETKELKCPPECVEKSPPFMKRKVKRVRRDTITGL